MRHGHGLALRGRGGTFDLAADALRVLLGVGMAVTAFASMTFAVLAQVQPAAPSADVFPPGSGWTATGVLVLVLSWVFLKMIPSKDAQVKELVTAKDAHVEKLTRDHNERMDAALESYKAALDVVLKHCERESSRAIDAFKAEIGRVADAGRAGR